MTEEEDAAARSCVRSWSGFVCLGLIAAAAYFLWTAHGDHVRAVLPYLLLLLCPIFHLLHGGHSHSSAGDKK